MPNAGKGATGWTRGFASSEVKFSTFSTLIKKLLQLLAISRALSQHIKVSVLHLKNSCQLTMGVLSDTMTTEEQMQDGKASLEHREHTRLSKDLTSNVSPFLIFFSIWISFAGWIINFDIGYTGTVYQMQPFNKAFGNCEMIPADSIPGNPPGVKDLVEFCSLSATAQSVGGSVHILFMGVGALLSGITGQHLGRRAALQLASLIVIVGAAGMLGTAGYYTAYIVCKCIGGIGIGQMQTLGPIYGVEVTPASKSSTTLGFSSRC